MLNTNSFKRSSKKDDNYIHEQNLEGFGFSLYLYNFTIWLIFQRIIYGGVNVHGNHSIQKLIQFYILTKIY